MTKMFRKSFYDFHSVNLLLGRLYTQVAARKGRPYRLLKMMPGRWVGFATLLMYSLGHIQVLADSVAPRSLDTSVATELNSFTLAEGFEIDLFASEKDGIANPIAMRFDSKGRLWVLCTLVYPQAIPLEPLNDKLFILEDTDRDGIADTSTVFADGLNMPTGFALGNGGVYVGEGTDLIFLRDTDGNDQSDSREVLLSGFGTGDTHQNINSFTWSPGGELFFCQGLHNFARVETEWGIVRMNEHGIWRYRPKTGQLHAFRGGSGQNPWGVAFGPWGEPFAKGNNRELSELLPVMIHTQNRHASLDIGQTKSKSMVAEIIDSPALPDEMQGDVLIAGYFAHMIDWLNLERFASAHKAAAKSPLLTSTHRSFRPVDIQTGPDGAIYIADWFNPIIGHYQASLRHPDRDKTHGRIWRITATDRNSMEVVDLTKVNNEGLLNRLFDAPLKERERIRIELSNRERPIDELIVGELHNDRAAFEALCLMEWHEAINPDLLARVFASEDPYVQAYAVRVAARWADRIENEYEYIGAAVNHVHPRVRLEGVVAAGQLKDPAAIRWATQVLNHKMDRFLSAALHQSALATKPHWFPALLQGQLTFENPKHLNYVLTHTEGADAATAVRSLLASGTMEKSARRDMATLLIDIGSVDDQKWVLERYANDGQIVQSLVNSAELGKPKPSGQLEALMVDGLTASDPRARKGWITLAGIWEARTLNALVKVLADDSGVHPADQSAAVIAYGRMMNRDAINDLKRWIKSGSPDVQPAAMKALVRVDLAEAVHSAQQILKRTENRRVMREILTPFMQREGGLDALSEGLDLSEKPAAVILEILGSAGQYSAKLDKVLRVASASDAIGVPKFDQTWVDTLAKEVRASGNATRGKALYHAPALNCVTCHKIGDEGGVLGPDLTVVGAGLPVEIIIESVLWPRRQIKEGYMASRITTKVGQVIMGHVKSEDQEKITIEDIATGKARSVSRTQIAKREDAGTLMPPGLTAGLSRGELRDIICYLAALR